MHFLSEMNYSPTIDLGNILTLVGMICTLYIFHMNNIKKITRLENRVQLMWNVFRRRFNISDQEEKDEEELT